MRSIRFPPGVSVASSPEIPQLEHTIARPMRAYEPPAERVRRRWVLIVAGLILTGLTSLSFRSVCAPDAPGANESAFGVRHERRGTQWYHCEPWIRRALTN